MKNSSLQKLGMGLKTRFLNFVGVFVHFGQFPHPHMMGCHFLWLGGKGKIVGFVREGVAMKESLLAIAEKLGRQRRVEQGNGILSFSSFCRRINQFH